MLISTIHMQESDIHRTVLNLLTGRWISPNGKLFQKLIREGYRYANRLSDYLEDIGTICVGEFELDPLADFYHPALIPPLSILAEREDICEKFIISVESAVMGGMSLFTLEKNKRSSCHLNFGKNLKFYCKYYLFDYHYCFIHYYLLKSLIFSNI